MIVSLVLKDKYNVGINSNNKVKVDGHLIAVSDIPFVRYRFSQYGVEECEFIKNNIPKFEGPVHMAEVRLSENSISEIERLNENENLAVFLYVPITDYDIANGLREETVELLGKFEDSEVFYDRIMIKDESTQLYPLAAERLKLQISEITGDTIKDIGVCGSPLSFRSGDEPGQACLTAVWARKLMSEYALSDNVVTPTANHENMTCCGCIKYLVVNSDLPAPLSTKEKSEHNKANKSSNEGDKSSEPKKPKAVSNNNWAFTDVDI